MHTKQDKVLIMKYYPKLSIHMAFIRTLLASITVVSSIPSTSGKPSEIWKPDMGSFA